MYLLLNDELAKYVYHIQTNWGMISYIFKFDDGMSIQISNFININNQIKLVDDSWFINDDQYSRDEIIEKLIQFKKEHETAKTL